MLVRRIACLIFCWAAASGLAAADPPPSNASADYVLQPSDVIHMIVFQEPDLERQVPLSQESTVTLPLIGTIDLKGKTVREAQKMIRDLYDRDYLVDPQVTLTVLTYSTRSVNVLGSVEKAGAVELPPDHSLRLLEAIAQAGGFTRLADRKHVKLTRTDADGKTTTYTINADEIIQSTSGDLWPLKKGDVIYVPERLL